MFFLQAFQTVIEKGRRVYLMVGMGWALEAARLSWQKRRPAEAGHPDTVTGGTVRTR